MLEHEDDCDDGEKDDGGDDSDLYFGGDVISCFKKAFFVVKIGDSQHSEVHSVHVVRFSEIF